ncbi:MAG: nuclear transport factor 2 family protein [Ignavibacteriaceae bacterium]|nr:nuclear transport factor 2 family protein [Ignavibacteriaceae bacterium]
MHKVTLVSILFFFVALNLSAQQWTDEQKEVWKGVETYNAVISSENPADILNYFDDSFYGWSYDSETPHTKADVQKSIKYWITKGKVVTYTITPARIWVNGNFAYVHYYYSQVSEGKDGKPIVEKGRYTDILMKKEGKWVMVGDHGGQTSK